jgi:hypothetical protein
VIELPSSVLRAPALLYGVAVVAFIASMGIAWSEVSSAYAYAEPGNPMIRQTMIRAFYQSAFDAICLAGTGLLAHILLAIHSRLRADDAIGGTR